MRTLAPGLMAALFLCGCWSQQEIFWTGEEDDTDTGTGTPDTDADIDSDADSDTDSSGETDSGGDTDSDTGPDEQVWAIRAGGTGNDSATHVEVLEDGSSLVTGYFEETAIFGEGESGQVTLVSAGDTDIFVARYRPNGLLEWAIRAGGACKDRGSGVAAYPDGSFVITGVVYGHAVFGEGEPQEDFVTPQEETGFFIARYEADGSLNWLRQAEGISRNAGLCVDSLPGGDSIVAGFYTASMTLVPGVSGALTMTTMSGEQSAFFAKYNSAGTVVWATGLPSQYWVSSFPEGSMPTDLIAEDSGEFWVAGMFEGNCVFGLGEENELSVMSQGGHDFFLANYNPDGTLQWVRTAGTWADDKGYGVSSNGDGIVAVTGYHHFSITLGPGEAEETQLQCTGNRDAFIATYDAAGNLIWADNAGGGSETYGYGVSMTGSESSTSASKTVVAGRFMGTAVFDRDEPTEVSIVSSGTDDVFVSRYQETGELEWVRRGGGPGNDVGMSVDANTNDKLIAVGLFSWDATFEVGLTDAVALSSTGGTDIFVTSHASQ